MAQTQRITAASGLVGRHHVVVLDCATCGEVFAVTAEYNTARRRDLKSFHCPNGHSNVYLQGETAELRELREAKARADAAEREAARQKELREWAETRARGANIAAGQAKAKARRLLHRVECGVCPHCKRTFKQLAAHMKSKHSGATK